MSEQHYCDFLEVFFVEKLIEIPEEGYIFQQDNTAGSAKNYLWSTE